MTLATCRCKMRQFKVTRRLKNLANFDVRLAQGPQKRRKLHVPESWSLDVDGPTDRLVGYNDNRPLQ